VPMADERNQNAIAVGIPGKVTVGLPQTLTNYASAGLPILQTPNPPIAPSPPTHQLLLGYCWEPIAGTQYIN
jgi:hypothetical protein